MKPFTAFLCTMLLGAGLTLAVSPARTPACAPPVTAHPDLPGLKTPASSFAPHAAARHRAYGMPIQAPILKRRAHRQAVPARTRHSPSAPQYRGQ
jgi:hypothetical protein